MVDTMHGRVSGWMVRVEAGGGACGVMNDVLASNSDAQGTAAQRRVVGMGKLKLTPGCRVAWEGACVAACTESPMHAMSQSHEAVTTAVTRRAAQRRQHMSGARIGHDKAQSSPRYINESCVRRSVGGKISQRNGKIYL